MTLVLVCTGIALGGVGLILLGASMIGWGWRS